MDVDERLRRAAHQLSASLAGERIPDTPRPARHAWMSAVVGALVTLGTVGGAAMLLMDGSPRVGLESVSSTTESSFTATTLPPAADVIQFVSDEHGFEITYPADWYRADEILAPALTSPPQQLEEVLSLGTFPLRPGGVECPHVPVNALLDLGSDDVLVSIILGNQGTGDRWPTAFGAASFLPTPAAGDAPIDAQTCSGRSDLDYHVGVFALDGRQVQIFVAFGAGVDDTTRAQTWGILDSFTWATTSPTATTLTTTTTLRPGADPATGPLFGDPSDVVLLFDDGIDGVLALDPDGRVGSRSVIDGQVAGSSPYRMTRVGDTLVVGWGSVYAVDIGTGQSTLLGDATIYVPAQETDRVWLVNWPGGSIGQGTPTVWQVDTSGNPLTAPTELDVQGFPAIGIPGGLALETTDGIRLWYPERGVTDVPLGNASAVVADASEDLLAYCPDSTCTEMHITDLNTGDTVVIPSGGFNTWAAGGLTARFSPNGSLLALTTEHGVALADTVTGTSTVIGADLTTEQPLYVAWSPDGSQLYAATYSYGQSETVLARYDIDAGTLETARVPFGGTLDFVVLAPDEAARFLRDEDQPPTSCPPVYAQPSGRTGVCGFRY